MKKLLVFVMLVSCSFIYAQNEVFMYNPDGTKEYFYVNDKVKYLQYKNSAMEDVRSLCSIAQKVDTVMPDILKFTLDETNIERFDRNALALDSVFLATELVYINDSTIQWCFNKIMLQVKDNTKLDNLLDIYDIPYNSYKPFGLAEYEYLVELSVSEAFQYASLLYETGAFNYVVPAFYRYNGFNNPLYSSQWGLKNTGQSNGIVGMDINAEPAWSLSTGKDVVIAVIDCGVQLDHPDLAANLLPGYDALGYGSNGGYSNTDYHGTACSGIIAAVDNTVEIKGVAYEAKIMPIRIGFGLSWSDEAAVSAFTYAYTHGADVISCSWGGGSPDPTLTNTINTVVNNGRNGLGSPVLFSSGNYYYNNATSVSYPASLSNTIAVGAMSQCGERKSPNSCDGETGWGSKYGDEMDVVAPGVLIPTTTINSNTILNFGGTSAACPHAAGVMALILSANPCLTATEARKILCSSCNKLNGYGCCCKQYGFWNEEVGYGKINAYKAVLMAIGLSHDYYVMGDIGQTSATTSWALENTGCMGLASGLYFVQKMEITKNITYPYVENPIIDVFTNGYSAASSNNGHNWFSISNITHTSAELKTYKYKVVTNAIGQQINQFFPAGNVWFNYTIYDAIEPNVLVNNVAIVNSPYNLNAFQNIETSNFTVQGSSVVRLRAGEGIFLGEGTYIEPNTSGDFYAYIEPFVVCENGNTRGEYGSQDTSSFNEDEYKEEEKITDFSSHVSCLVDENGSTSSMIVYPNPVTGTFNIRLGNPYEAIGRVDVANLQGSIVFSKNNVSNDGIDISAIPQGMYVVRVTSNMGNVYFGKFVKE